MWSTYRKTARPSFVSGWVRLQRNLRRIAKWLSRSKDFTQLVVPNDNCSLKKSFAPQGLYPARDLKVEMVTLFSHPQRSSHQHLHFPGDLCRVIRTVPNVWLVTICRFRRGVKNNLVSMLPYREDMCCKWKVLSRILPFCYYDSDLVLVTLTDWTR